MSEQIRKRVQNRCALLRALHFAGALQRAELSRRCGIRKSSITNLVSGLLQNGVLREEEPGNIRSPLALRGGGHYALALCIHDSTLGLAAAVYLDGSLGAYREVSLAGLTPGQALDALADLAQSVRAQQGGKALGLGLATPGLIDLAQGVLLHAANLNGWRNVAIRERLVPRFGLNLHLENDIRCQLWAAAWFGRRLLTQENLLYLGLGEGVACASLMHGRRVIGGNYSAGEIGHIRCGEEGRICGCGKADCLEAYCSLTAIRREIVAAAPSLTIGTGAAGIARAARESRVVENVLDRVAGRVARALAPILGAQDPEAVLLGTDSPEFSELLRTPLERHLAGELLGLNMRHVIGIAPSTRQTSLQGAAALVFEEAFARDELIPGGGVG